MNLLDFAHSIVTGEYKLQREVVREQLAVRKATASKRSLLNARMQLYAGAEPGINRPMPAQLSTPEDCKQAFERIVLIRAARQMEEDYGFFDGLLDDFETYVIGEELVYEPNTGNPDADKLIREYLEWQFDQCDYSQRLDLTKMAQLFVRSMKRDGECGAIPVDVGDAIKLRYYSGDLIGNPLVGANIGPRNYNGIIVDEDTEAPFIYQLYKRLPKLNAYVWDRDVPADQFWHYYDPFRLQQYHGVTTFKTAIRDGFDIDQILEFSKMNIKFRASQLPSVHTETGRPRGAGIGYGWGLPSGPGAPNPNGTPTVNGVPQPMEVQVSGVTSTYLKLDESVMEYPNDFPNPQLHVTIDELRRQCCKGAHVPYEFAYRSEAGGVVQRFWADKAMKTFGKDKFLVKRVILNPFKNRSIQKGIDTGFLDLSSFGNLSQDIARFKGRWNMGETVVVDYGKENETDIKLMEAGVMSPQEYAGSQNKNIDTIRKEIATHTLAVFEDAAAISKATGQDIALILPFLVKKFPNPGAGLTAAGADGTVPKQTVDTGAK